MIDTASILAALLLSAQGQPAPEPAAAEAAAKPVTEETAVAQTDDGEVDDDDKVVCRRTAVVGSKFKKKICGTKKQWETLEARARDTTQQFQRRGKGLEPVGN